MPLKPREPAPNIRKVNPLAWMLTFSDLLTLMLVFFVLLYAMSSLDDRKFKGAFGTLSAAFGALGKTKEAEITPDPFQGIMAPVPEFLVRDIRDMLQRHLREIPEEVKKPPKIRPIPDSYRSLFKVERVDDGVEIRIAAAILFDDSGRKLNRWSAALLREVGDEVAEWGVPIRIESYVSPTEQDRDAAWNLSVYRAAAVTSLIASVPGVEPQLLSMVGYGRSAPRPLKGEDGSSLVLVKFFTSERDAADDNAEIVPPSELEEEVQ